MSKIKLLMSTAILSMLSSAALAGPIVDFTNASGGFGLSNWSLGYKFHVDSNVTAVGLGTYDFNKDGLAGPQQVGLWDSTGTLLASTFVDNSSALDGVWRFKSIAPIVLNAGQSYYVASQGGEGYAYSPVDFTVDSSITYERNAWHYVGSTDASPLAFPDTADGMIGYFGGNVMLGTPTTSVPEPFSLALLGVGALAFGASRRAAKSRG
jgi:hypothetical protein